MKSRASPGRRYESLLQLLRTAEAIWNASRVFFARWKLGPSQFNILNLLYEQPAGCTQIELSRRLLMHRSNVTGLVDRLEKRGLLRRQDSSTDRRAYTLVLTTTGRKLMEKILPHYYRAAEGVWASMGLERTRQLVRDLELVSRNAGRLAQNEKDENE